MADAESKAGLLARLLERLSRGKAEDTQKESKALWTERLTRRMGSFRDVFTQMALGLFARDRATRRMARLFFLSCVGLAVVGTLALQRYRLMQLAGIAIGPDQGAQATSIAEFVRQQTDEARRRNTLIRIGEFVLELKRLPAQVDVPGVIGLAEVELVAECDEPETCRYIQDHAVQIQNVVATIFTALDRDELLSREGKRKLKKRIVEKINWWLPRGKIEGIYFSKLIVS